MILYQNNPIYFPENKSEIKFMNNFCVEISVFCEITEYQLARFEVLTAVAETASVV
jgi:hypothetical protein